MPFGLFGKPSFEKRWKSLQAERSALHPILAMWPPQIRNEAERRSVLNRWSKAVELGQGLLSEQPNDINVLLTMGHFYRMGHNIDVPQAAQRSMECFRQAMAIYPDDYRGPFGLASLFASLDPVYAPEGEQLFLKAEELAGLKVVPDIYQGLGFVTLVQGKNEQALVYFERYLNLGVLDHHVEEIVAHLKAGKAPRIVNG